MIKLVLFLFLFGAPTSQDAAKDAIRYTGKLDAQLTPSNVNTSFKSTKATAEQRKKLPPSVEKNAEVFAGELRWMKFREPGHKLFLVQPVGKPAYLFVDINKDEKITIDERFSFSPVANNKEIEGELVLQFPLANSAYKAYPVKLRLSKLTDEEAKGDKRYIGQSLSTYAIGKVPIDGREVLVQYQINTEIGKVDYRNGYLGIDADGDGKVNMSFVSYESAYAKDETVIFRVGEKYVSTESLDAEKGLVILRDHPKSDYQRIELKLGGELPDFSFVDFEGKNRQFSEFRGKYVLLEFWGTWCGPCVADVSHLVEAYAKFNSRGFEILGMDEDKDIEQVKTFLKEKGITWTQATTPSIKEFADKRLRIIAYPTIILLDPQGKILSLGMRDQLPIRGKALAETLEKLLPQAP